MHMWENGWQAKLALYQVPRQNERISRFVSKVQAQKCLRDCLVPATAGCVVVRLKDRDLKWKQLGDLSLGINHPALYCVQIKFFYQLTEL